MKRFYFSKLVILATILLGLSTDAFAQPVTFTYSGGILQYYTVPVGVSAIQIDMSGAQGGKSSAGSVGGLGGRVVCNMNVTAGQVYNLYVGNNGANNASPSVGGANGAGGGAQGGNGYGNGAGGGGATDIRFGGIALANRILVAGGGGGAGYNCAQAAPAENGGAGGGLTGGQGWQCGNQSTCTTGSGGSQTGAGNTGGNCTQISNGTQANGAGGTQTSYVGGGGGGYFGGGEGYYGGGGGGSSFPAAAGGNITAVTHTQGYNTGGGYITITALVPTVSASPTPLNFGIQTVGTPSVPQFTALTGVRLSPTSGTLTVTAPIGYQVATDANPTFANSVTVTYLTASTGPTNLYVQFNPAFPVSYCAGVITVSGGGQPTNCTIPVCGTGVAACSALPTAGTAVVTPTTGSFTTPFTLSLTGSSVGGSISYQWQSAPSATGPWTPINGAVTSTYTLSGLAANTWFECLVTCPGHGTSTSTVTAVTIGGSGLHGSSCTPSWTYSCPTCPFEVGNSTTNPFVINGYGGTQINDPTVYSGSAYHDLTLTQNVTMLIGGNYSGTSLVSDGSGYDLSAQIWIDFNNDGVMQSTETVGGAYWTTGNMPNIPINIPSTGINPGTYRMRVAVDYACCGGTTYPSYPNLNPCSGMYYADYRDYTVTIITPPCAGNPEPGIIFEPVTSSCGSFNANGYSIGAGTGNGISNTWQTSPDNVTWTPVPASANLATYTQSVASTMYIQNLVTCAFGGSSATNSVKLTINPQPVAITGPTTFCSSPSSSLSDATPGGAWSSSNPAVAAIGSTGIVTGASGGTATITYQLPAGCYTTTNVTVYLSPTAIIGASNVCTTQTDNLSDATPGGVWTSSFPAFASISGSGVVTGNSPGTTNITYTIPTGGCYVTMPVTANQLPAPLTGTATVCPGTTTTLSSTSAGGTWASTNSFDATVTGTGLVTGVAAGNPNIIYTLPGGCTATKTLTVNQLPSAITGTANVCAGSTTALSDATGGGVWSSSSPTIATVSGGVVSGITSGVTNIAYTVSATGCSISTPVVVNPLPAVKTVTGGGGYCSGSLSGVHVGLSGSDIGINYTVNSTPPITLAGTNSGLDFGTMTAVGTYTVLATDGTTGCTSNMAGSATVSVNSLPNPYTVSVVGTGYACAGSPGVDINLSGSDAGVSYQVYNGLMAVGLPVAGTGVGTLDLGFQATGGTYTVVGTNTATLCTNNMTGSATVNINPAPTVYNVTGGGAYCTGGAGVHDSLDNSFGGIDYKVYYGGSLINTVPGTGSPLDLGIYFGAGTYTVVAFDISSSCTSNMAGSATIVVNPLPLAETVTGGGAYCTGSPSPHVELANSVSGVYYQLYVGVTTAVGAPLLGSNASLDFGAQTAGAYTVIATNAFGCSNNMTGSVNIIMNSLPTTYPISSGNGYCAGGTGVDVALSPSDVGVNYQLYNGGVAVGLPKPGTGSLLDFGSKTATGTYTITGTNTTTGCSSVMTGTSVISINPLPTVYTVSGGGHFCAGTGGTTVIVSGSDIGVNYVPMVGGGPLPGMSGTGSSLDFTGETAPGAYTVVATNGTTSCSSVMAGSAIVTVDPVPNPYTVTGGGSYCAGGAGKHVGLLLSTLGVNYQLMLGGGPVGSILGGTGASLDFGIFSTGGIYTVQGTNATSGCTNNMGGSVTIAQNPTPAPYTVTVVGTGGYCPGTTGVDVQLSGSVTDVDYQLWDGGVTSGVSKAGTGSAIDFGFKTAGTYTAVASDHITGCTSNMVASAVVTANAAPHPYAVTGGGTRCAFAVGDTIGLGGSEFNTNYQVYNTVSGADGGAWAGTNLPIYLGLHTNAGSYIVVATNPATTCSDTMSGSAMIVVDTAVTPSLTFSISTGSDTVCAGKTTTFTAMPINGGSVPVYTWKVNGVTVSTGSTLSYIAANGDIVDATMISTAVCPLPAMASSSTVMTVEPSLLPAVSVTANHSGLICPNTSVTFTATPTNGGTTPSYQWIKNGNPVGTGGITYTYNATTNDIVFAELMSSYQCRTSDFVLSNNTTLTMNEPVLPVFTVTTDKSTTIRSQQTITFTANVTNTTGAFTYQWYINGVLQAGQTNPTLTSGNFSDDDVVKCVVTSVGACGGLSATESTLITVLNTTGVTPVNGGSDVRVVPNPNKGAFTVKGTLATAIDQEVSLEITDMLGQVVYSNKVMAQGGNINEQVQLSKTLANGMYILTVRSDAETKAFHFVLEQ